MLLHTTVTIGYDVAWPQVHRLLPRYPARPFVLQTSLGDYYVSYQLNACAH